MPARILIVDSVATNRIVLKVKMLAAHFVVDACANRQDAEIAIAMHRPDLVLINMSSDHVNQAALCKALRSMPEATSMGIIALGVADTSQARFAALDAGADDVMSHPIHDALLLARIRSLLRVRSARQELVLRDTTSRALGFEEAPQEFEAAAQVALVTTTLQGDVDVFARIQRSLRHEIRMIDMVGVLHAVDLTPIPDLFILDATVEGMRENRLFGLVSDLRSRSETRLATQLVIVRPDQQDFAAMCLDLGADDVVMLDADLGELTLRAKALIQLKQQSDRLRDTVRSGLNAAITDPLTGLYNRRYVVPHLTRMAEDASKSDGPFAVMMIDIDHFKAINDTYGHAAGDCVLVQLADRLRENLRAIDLVARMGGEEFLVTMPRTSVRRAELAADRLRRLVNNTPFDLGNSGPAVKVTVSVGVAVSDKPCEHMEGLNKICDLADQALYVAKSAGRNQVAMSKSAA